jgi:beta-fructofuranosidase
LGDRHVLVVSRLQSSVVLYFVGTCTDHRFIPEREGIVDYGAHFFAPQVMIDRQGRRLILGWVWEGRSEAAQRAAGWAGVQSLPRVLSLAPDLTLLTRPVPELTALRQTHTHLENVALSSCDVPLPVQGDSLEIVAEFQVGRATCGLKLRCAADHSQETVVGYEVGAGYVFVDRERASQDPEAQGGVQRAPLSLDADETLKLHLFLDRSMVELFANERRCLTSRIYPSPPYDSLGVKLFASGGDARLKSLDVWSLKSVWPGSA